jgi:pilus assembly protein Flp/PilA
MSSIISYLVAAAQTRQQEGQAMVEYGLILGLVSVIAIVALTAIGADVNGVYTTVAGVLAAVPGA